MDPWLKAHWRDVHSSLIIYARDQLQPRLPGDLRARVEERVFIQSRAGRERIVYPDLSVTEHPRRGGAPAAVHSGLAMAEAIIVHLPEDTVTERYLEIREAGSGVRVITVLEVLSTTNKYPGEGQTLYLQKQQELKHAGVSLVEIDLLRAGRRVLSVPPEHLAPEHRRTYQFCVRRGWERIAVEVFGASLRERLPVLPIPLRETEDDAPLDLQALLDLCYENGGYDDIDYTVKPDPPLEAEDAAWADAMLRTTGLRS